MAGGQLRSALRLGREPAPGDEACRHLFLAFELHQPFAPAIPLAAGQRLQRDFMGGKN